MTDRETHDITITLVTIDELFDEPAPDYWTGGGRSRSGIDEIWAKLRRQAVAGPVHITIRLPRDAITPDLAARTRAALARYADARVEANEDEVAAVKREGRRNFFISIAVVIALFLALALLDRLLPLNETALAVIIAWTGIAVWAILWNPVDTYVWGWRPNRHDMRLCDKLRAAEVAVVPID